MCVVGVIFLKNKRVVLYYYSTYKGDFFQLKPSSLNRLTDFFLFFFVKKKRKDGTSSSRLRISREMKERIFFQLKHSLNRHLIDIFFD